MAYMSLKKCFFNNMQRDLGSAWPTCQQYLTICLNFLPQPEFFFTGML